MWNDTRLTSIKAYGMPPWCLPAGETRTTRSGQLVGRVRQRPFPQPASGGEANLLYNLCCSCPNACDCCQPALGYRVDLISGVCYLDLREGLGITENIQVLPGAPVFPGDSIRTFDQFDTRNQFHGGQLGARAEVARAPVRRCHGQSRPRGHAPDGRYQRLHDDHAARGASHRSPGGLARSADQHRPLFA